MEKDTTDEVCKDLQARSKLGEAKYGRRLTAFNGRDSLLDAYEEACDLVCYLKNKLIEDEQTSKNKRKKEKKTL